MFKEKIKTVKLTTNQTVRIPSQLIRKMGLDVGTDFDVSIQDETIVFTPLVKIPRSQRYFWTKEWQEAERKVDEDISKGRVKKFDTAEDFIVDLQNSETI